MCEAPNPLLHRYRLGQIPRLVYIRALDQGDMVAE